ncbi:MAG: SWIM zinc finger family protein, partial [Eubacteriales bacterium]|nr:SWIM zinc finger family protein [Eubacteriales bacterium]
MKLDLAQVKSLFSNADYARGMEYFRQGRVLDMTAGEGENPIVKCCVRGSEVYSVRFQQLEYGYMRIGCSCPRFEDMGKCKHIAAAMIAYVEDPPRPAAAHSDRYAQALLQSYLQKSREQQP